MQQNKIILIALISIILLGSMYHYSDVELITKTHESNDTLITEHFITNFTHQSIYLDLSHWNLQYDSNKDQKKIMWIIKVPVNLITYIPFDNINSIQNRTFDGFDLRGFLENKIPKYLAIKPNSSFKLVTMHSRYEKCNSYKGLLVETTLCYIKEKDLKNYADENDLIFNEILEFQSDTIDFDRYKNILSKKNDFDDSMVFLWDGIDKYLSGNSSNIKREIELERIYKHLRYKELYISNR